MPPLGFSKEAGDFDRPRLPPGFSNDVGDLDLPSKDPVGPKLVMESGFSRSLPGPGETPLLPPGGEGELRWLPAGMRS